VQLPDAGYQLTVRADSALSACSGARSEHPGYKLPMQTGAVRRWREDAEMDHIGS